VSNYDDYCKVCRRALMKFSQGGVVTWTHQMQFDGPDHEPVPVPLSEIPDPEMFCDFCSAPNPPWTYACIAPQMVNRQRSPRMVTMGSHTGRYEKRLRDVSTREAKRWGTSGGANLNTNAGEIWAACDGCADLIDADDRYGLISRVVAAMPAKLSKGNKLAPLRGELAGMFEPFFATKERRGSRIAIAYNEDDMPQARYICKECGAESPAGIGYVLGPGEEPRRATPDPDCPNTHMERG
jgi:hypothetical protein